jgi:hypothetical protein
VDFTSHAELAVRLANSAPAAAGPEDGLGSQQAFRALIADRPALGSLATCVDLQELRLLGDELHTVFIAAAAGREDEAATRLNSLLIQHPVRPVLIRHEAQGWHLHLVEAGSAADQLAAAAIFGLAMTAALYGFGRFGCARSPPARARSSTRATTGAGGTAPHTARLARRWRRCGRAIRRPLRPPFPEPPGNGLTVLSAASANIAGQTRKPAHHVALSRGSCYQKDIKRLLLSYQVDHYHEPYLTA